MIPGTSILGRYRARAEAFEAKVANVRSDQWINQSPCAQWTALEVVDHVIEMHGVMLGHPIPRTEDPLTDFREARRQVQEALDSDRARSEVSTPAGPMTLEDHVDQVVSDDLVLHGWDLARATGQDETIPATDVERLWATATAVPADLMERFRTPGAFGPGIEVYGAEIEVPQDAPLQDRLLGYVGRDPMSKSL
ncbi:TIGR03086 family metal-binding protein [Lentzea sp. BCCO 10_0061]|uniref:TIGR03086 family metal-binding protein n=1 Tax=Lentzea sokolovensis TaxID=3095429 RepID=A0ABU4V9S6_9PSEU|nr:TIGR03086 family metal-binding protein [Lentzea sp. BCCO 10_0061]MDX8148536.1 TIGR03086 family metal-binding protein [Lentzea sp. BCCO 10_0061]